MEVIPSQLHRIGAALHDLAAELRTTLTSGQAGPGDRAGPSDRASPSDRAGLGDPAWATDAALRSQTGAWDAYLTGLAARLDRAGAGLVDAATGYLDVDDRAVRRWGRELC